VSVVREKGCGRGKGGGGGVGVGGMGLGVERGRVGRRVRV
jgi:hypothetical protein